MKYKLFLVLNIGSKEMTEAISLDNITAPENLKINMKFKNNKIYIKILSDDIGSIINTIDEILSLMTTINNLEKNLKSKIF